MANQQLLDFIKQQLQQGVGREAIRNNLLNQGWQLQDLNEAFLIIDGGIQQYQSFSSSGTATKTGKAKASLVLGIIGLIAWFIPLVGAPITITGLILGIKGLKSLKRGMAVAGVVLSTIGLVATIANFSIGVYLGVTGQHDLANKLLNQDSQEVKNQIPKEATPTQQAFEPQPTISDYLEKQPYTNTQYGFRIHAPKGWRIDESGLFGTHVFFFNTDTELEGNNSFSANINVVSEPAQGLDLKGYVKATKESLSKVLTDYKLVDDKNVSIRSGRQAQFIGGTFIQGESNLRNLQLMVVDNDKGYVVTATVLESAWDKYKDLIEASLLTFEPTNN